MYILLPPVVRLISDFTSYIKLPEIFHFLHYFQRKARKERYRERERRNDQNFSWTNVRAIKVPTINYGNESDQELGTWKVIAYRGSPKFEFF